MQIFLLWILFSQFHFFPFLIFVLYCWITSANKIHDYIHIIILFVVQLLKKKPVFKNAGVLP